MASTNMSAFGAMFFSLISVLWVWYVVTLIAGWKMFTKAGEKGWKSLIPIYSDYIRFKISWSGGAFWLYALASAAQYIIPLFAEAPPAVFSLIALAAIVIKFMQTMKLSQAFGHGILFGIGLWVLEPLFIAILAFGRSEYQGKP